MHSTQLLSYLTISRDNLFKHPQTLPPALDHGGTGWSSASSSTALLSCSLPLPLSTSPSPSPPPFFFFPVFMTFTHFLFNEKKTSCLVAYIFSEEFWGIFMAKEPLRNGLKKLWGFPPS